MLTINGRTKRVCSGLTRRDLIRTGGLGLFGLNVPQLLAAEDARVAPTHVFSPGTPFPKGRAKSVLFLYLFGGPSQLETFDMKPDAPSQLRGPFQPIDSRTPGLRICEHLHRTAALSDRLAIIRSMTHSHNDHNACHYIQTGHKWTRSAENGSDVNARPTDWPAMGSVVEYVSQHSAGRNTRTFPDYVYLPNRLGHLQAYDRTGQYAGWLGNAYNALATDIRRRDTKDNPFFRECTEAELDFRIKGLVSKTDMPLDRLDRRRSLLEQFDASRSSLDQTRSHAGYSGIQQRALDLVTSDRIRSALDIQRESAALRDKYGRHLFGQSVLMGRRMIEAGCRFVSVIWDAPDGYSWDSHQHSSDMRDHLLPKFDQSFSALITDMEDRGLLDDTLVVAVGEMGRTPKANAAWGRGHWSYSFPCVLAGAGIRGGIMHGASDKDAAYPIENPVSPEDLAATIYNSLGLSHEIQIPDAQGRPVSILESGRPLSGLFA
ncbi:MAG: DUF1501 domain-containing protein [Planctomycetota bacterium]|nr:DUF1501 domain-containing protein [Planctomycetota bacterium]